MAPRFEGTDFEKKLLGEQRMRVWRHLSVTGTKKTRPYVLAPTGKIPAASREGKATHYSLAEVEDLPPGLPDLSLPRPSCAK